MGNDAKTSEQKQAFIESVIDTHGTRLLRIAMLYLNDRHLAEDAVRESFVKIYRHFDRYDEKRSEKAWVTSIVINTCKDMLRGSWMKRIKVQDPIDDRAVPGPDIGGAGDNTDELESGAAEITDRTVVNKLHQLPPKYKDILLLYYYQEMSVSEIAETLHKTENCIRVRLNRARNLLRDELKGWWNSNEEEDTDSN